MTEEASVPVLILCQPESEVAEVIRKRLEQKGVPFCILPVGSHFAPPRIPDTCGVVLIPLCRELMQIPLSDTLHQLQQAGATLLPLGREDAAPLWKALTAGEEESIAQQKVFQLEDLWEKQLPILTTGEDESAPLLPILPQPKVNRKAPSLDAPLVDLNIPDLPPSPPVRFTSSSSTSPTPEPTASPTAGGDTSTLKGWILLFLFPSLAVLALVLWKSLAREAPHEGSSTIPTATYPPTLTEQQEAQVPRTNELTEEAQGDRPSSSRQTVTTSPDTGKSANPEGKKSSEETAASSRSLSGTPAGTSWNDDGTSYGRGHSGERFSLPTYVTRSSPVEDEAQPPVPSPTSTPAPEAADKKRTSPPAPGEKVTPSNTAQPKPHAPSNESQKTESQSATERQGEGNHRATPSSPSQHYCPSDEDCKKARKGGNIHALLEKGAKAGCPRCQHWLKALQNR